MRYAGYQIAAVITGIMFLFITFSLYIPTAWIVYTVVLFFLLLLLMLLVFFPSELGYYYYEVLYVLKTFRAFTVFPLPPSVLVVWTVFLTVSQIIICKLLFVAKESSAMKTLIIDNKSVTCVA